MNKLQQLHRQLEVEYYFYRSGAISQKEYLKRAKPIDMEITQIEMTSLLDIPVLIAAFSQD